MEYQRLVAHLQRARYEELLKVGFTAQQALELSKNVI